VPLPVQRPLPVLFAGSAHDRNVARIAATGDGWIPVMGAEPSAIVEGRSRIDAARSARGRGDEPFTVRVELEPRSDARGRPDVDATLAQVPALLAAGATDVQFPMPYFAPDVDRARPVLEHLADAWRDVGATRSVPTPR
jgi:alkanesulfonate monooxygenase SsuD/methylene tetrahydromethanopterin reductase-like flavin-dependent oxidoreductase (luciferase family)